MTIHTAAKKTPMMVFPGVCAIFKPTGHPISNNPAVIKHVHAKLI
jgi:hypothetical protein